MIEENNVEKLSQEMQDNLLKKYIQESSVKFGSAPIQLTELDIEDIIQWHIQYSLRNPWFRKNG